MWTSLGKSVGDFVEERLTSPLISSFALAWAAVNYKFFVILFSNNTASMTFYLIERICFPDWYSRIWFGFLLPLGLALSYLYLLPLPARAVYGHWRENLRKTDEIKLKHEINKRLTVEESQEYKKRVNDLEVQLDTATGNIRTLRLELQTLYASDADSQKLKGELEKTKAELAAVHSDLAAALMRLKDQTARVEDLKEMQSRGVATVENINAQIAAAQSQADELFSNWGATDTPALQRLIAQMRLALNDWAKLNPAKTSEIDQIVDSFRKQQDSELQGLRTRVKTIMESAKLQDNKARAILSSSFKKGEDSAG